MEIITMKLVDLVKPELGIAEAIHTNQRMDAADCRETRFHDY